MFFALSDLDYRSSVLSLILDHSNELKVWCTYVIHRDCNRTITVIKTMRVILLCEIKDVFELYKIADQNMADKSLKI